MKHPPNDRGKRPARPQPARPSRERLPPVRASNRETVRERAVRATSTAAVPRGQATHVGDISKSLASSLQSTRDGLQRFLVALKESGMHEAVTGYRDLQGVLLQQRHWAHSHDRSELIPLFAEIARVTKDIHKILAAYADIMRPLTQLGDAVPPPVNIGVVRAQDEGGEELDIYAQAPGQPSAAEEPVQAQIDAQPAQTDAQPGPPGEAEVPAEACEPPAAPAEAISAPPEPQDVS